MLANKLIKSRSLQPLVLNEAFDSTPQHKKYIFSGVFTACSVPGHVVINRNNRSYPENEVLRHLGYLRESIQTNGCLLGELDHPEGRFDIQLKEASHKITDLWYNQGTHCVMGKLEILDTPNGKIAQELVEAGYPLFVSSRAAGDVDEKTHEVTIAQIFTYDIVCTPGFAEAKLQQVNESLNANTLNYLTESVSTSKNVTNKYKVLIEGVSVTDTEQDAPINEHAMKMKEQPINMKELSKPLLEDDEFQLPEADVSPNAGSSEDVESSESDKKEEKKEDSKEEKTSEESKKTSDDKEKELTDEDKKKNRELILNITSEDSEGESSEDADEDSEKTDKRKDIVSVEAKEETEETEEKDSDDKEESDKEESDKEESSDKDEVKEDEEKESQKAKKLEKQTKKDMEKFQNILDNLSKVESVKESIIENYPFARSLSPENFARFAALKPEQKRKCMRFVVENNIRTIKDINELWATPLNEERRMLKNWLRLASPEDIALYTQATLEEQNAIENMARYCILETKQDVEEFWHKTGLRQRIARQKMNEAFVEKYKVVQNLMQN